MTSTELPFEGFRLSVGYESILPSQGEMLIEALREFGITTEILESSFEDGSFTILFGAESEDEEPLILEATKALLGEIYGPIGAAWSRIDGEWV